jgi:GntR family transcriptional regulator
MSGRCRLSPVASMLGVEAGGRLLVRRWVQVRDDVPSELVSCWFPLELTYGTDLDQADPLPVAVRAHLHSLKGVRIDHITERLTARVPTAEEAEALGVKTAPVLSILAAMQDAADAVRFVAEVVLPGGLHELEDVYSVPS